MAIYHMSMQVIGRSSGRSVIAAAAYRAGDKLVDNRVKDHTTGEHISMVFDYSNKKNVYDATILAPSYAPDWMKNRQQLWEGVTRAEKRKDSQLAKEIDVAIPIELSEEDGTRLVHHYVREQFVSEGMVADVAIHWEEGNPHAHIMLTTRDIEGEGFGKKNRDWNRKDFLAMAREGWSKHANQMLMECGIEQRISHLSYKDQGIELEPTIHVGVEASAMDSRGEESELVDVNHAIYASRADLLERQPEHIIQLLASQRATFTKQDIAKEIFKQVGGEEELYARVHSKVMASDLLEKLPETDRFGQERFASVDYMETEHRVLEYLDHMLSKHDHVLEEDAILPHIRSMKLSDEQADAVQSLVGGANIAAVTGKAGTGKTTMINALVKAYEVQGYRVRGAALSGVAAEKLGMDADIESRTLASWSKSWERSESQPHHPKKDDVFIIDEIGMVDVPSFKVILKELDKAGSKVVVIGDQDQLQPIGPGQVLRAITQRTDTKELTQVWRQTLSWQKEASMDYAAGDILSCINAYESHGHMHYFGSQDRAIHEMAYAYLEQRDSNKTQIMMAYTTKEVACLNHEVRTILKQEGTLGKSTTVYTSKGKYEFAEGERIMFLKNEYHELRVKNGTFGTVQSFNDHVLEVEIGQGAKKRLVHVNTKVYDHIGYGYACTVHKAQGATVDRAYVLASQYFDYHVGNVALTRHRESLDVYLDKSTFSDLDDFVISLQREHDKELVSDFTNQSRHMDTVALYKDTSIKAAELYREIYVWSRQNNVLPYDHEQWSDWIFIKDTRDTCAKTIAEDWSIHRIYARVSGVRKHTVFKHAGLIERQISQLEKDAQSILNDYVHADEEDRLKLAHYMYDNKPLFHRFVSSKQEWQHITMEANLYVEYVREQEMDCLSMDERYARLEYLNGRDYQDEVKDLSCDIRMLFREKEAEEAKLKAHQRKTENLTFDMLSTSRQIKASETFIAKTYMDSEDALISWYMLVQSKGLEPTIALVKSDPTILGPYKGRNILGIRSDSRKDAEKLADRVASVLEHRTICEEQHAAAKERYDLHINSGTEQRLKEEIASIDACLGRFSVLGTERLESKLDKDVSKELAQEIELEERYETLLEEHDIVMSLEIQHRVETLEQERKDQQIESCDAAIDDMEKNVEQEMSEHWSNDDVLLNMWNNDEHAALVHELEQRIEKKRIGLIHKYDKAQRVSMQKMYDHLKKLERQKNQKESLIKTKEKSEERANEITQELMGMEKIYESSKEREKAIEVLSQKLPERDQERELELER